MTWLSAIIMGLVQGIADLVLVFDEHAEILDYKTDRSRDAAFYLSLIHI